MNDRTCIAFEGSAKIASGELYQVAIKAKAAVERGQQPVLIFDEITSEPVEIDFRGSETDLATRLAAPAFEPANRRPGRPKLGVVPREVTLLPRHWEWLNSQPGGASVALRKLVEEARKANASKDRVRVARESAYRFMSAMAGNEAGFEEATRALFAGDAARFRDMITTWPPDVRDHALELAQRSFGEAE